MNRTCVSAAILFACISAMATLAMAEPVSFMPLGDLPGGTFASRATAISADGTTVVGYSTSNQFNPAGGDVAFRWQAGALQSLGALFTFPTSSAFSRAYGVSGNGSIVSGQSRETFNSAFVWNNGVMNSGGEENFPLNMSANGVMVGFTTFGPNNRAWRSGTGALPVIPGGNIFAQFVAPAYGVSDDGNVVVGEASYTSGPTTPYQAFRWTPVTSTQGLGFLLPGHNESRATAVSGDGLVIGGYSGPSPFLWTQAGGMIPFSGNFVPTAMSFDGSVIVGGGAVWDAIYGTRSLISILTGAGINMTGWSISEITDVSADGLVVVGTANNPQGNAEGFHAVIPEPATAGLLLLGAVTLLRRRHSA